MQNNNVGEITGKQIQLNDFDKGMPMRCGLSNSKKINLNTCTDFDLFDQNSNINISYYDPLDYNHGEFMTSDDIFVETNIHKKNDENKKNNENEKNNENNENNENKKIYGLNTERFYVQAHVCNNFTLKIYDIIHNKTNKQFILAPYYILFVLNRLYKYTQNEIYNLKYNVGSDIISLCDINFDDVEKYNNSYDVKFNYIVANELNSNYDYFCKVSDIKKINDIIYTYTNEKKVIMTNNDIMITGKHMIIKLNGSYIKNNKIIIENVDTLCYNYYTENSYETIYEFSINNSNENFGVLYTNKTNVYITTDILNNYIIHMEKTHINRIILPKIKLFNKMTMNTIFKNHGLTEIFTDISNILHIVSIDFIGNTSSIISTISTTSNTTSISDNEYENSDKIPFMFYVRNTITNIITIIGFYN